MAAADAGTSTGGTTTGDVKRAFDFSVSDFATIVTTTAYVDKSLMIRDVYNASSRILITAPPRFGKSTNLDMVKRFFEVEVDARGIAKPVHTTNNYKLFKDYNLEISKNIGFFNEHFGKHPVVHIGFKPLGRVDKSAKILDALKMIVKNSLNQHNYILQHSLKEQLFNGITGFDEDDFKKCLSDGITEDVDEVNLANNFNHLSTILKSFFGKKVFVLIDSYDAFLDSSLFENNTDREKMMSFVESSVGRLLYNVNCVDRVLITGVIPVVFEGFLCSENNIERYQFLDSHPFTKYYGLTSAEVDTVLSKVIECDEERDDVRNTINDYYNAYETRNGEIRVYNIWSVLQYLCRRTVQSYWCERRYINKFIMCFSDGVIRNYLQKLLLGHMCQLNISQPLSMTEVSKVTSMIATGEYEHRSEVKFLFVLFYHFGYLSAIIELSRGVVGLNIPSEEIKYELATAYFDKDRELYSSPYMNNIFSALDAIHADATEPDQNCETFGKNVYSLYQKGNFPFTKILEFLYVNFVTNGIYSRVMGRILGPYGPEAVLLKNMYKVAICITYDGSQNASNTHHKVTIDGGGEHVFDVFNDVRGKVIIAIDSTGGFAYSYYFKTGDNLQDVRTGPKTCTGKLF